MASIAVIGWFVSPLIGKVLEHAILVSKDRWKLWKGAEKEIDRLNDVLLNIRDLLEDAEKKQIEKPGVLAWLGKLKEVLLDAEDILDRHEVDLEVMEQQVRRFNLHLPCLSRGMLHLRVAKQIRKIRDRLDSKLKQGRDFGLQQIVAAATDAQQTPETTSSLANMSSVVGREAEKRAIVDMLLVDSEKPLVLPIIGMGGVGKTTLARLVFRDTTVEAFFKSTVWLPIGMSQDLDLKRLTIQIFNSICPPEKKIQQNGECYTLDKLQNDVVEELKHKTPFLLVLDDAWDTKDSSWTTLLEPLIASKLKCRIIVTTRVREVSDAFGSEKFSGHRLEPIQLNCLKNNDMWSIFSSHAFGNESVDIYPQLKSIGEQIVSRLEGLPLAAAIAGGILRGSRDARDWRKISESKLLEIKDKNNHMPSVLMLSYDNLPALLKQCFLYFSLFPEDYTFVSEKESSYRSSRGMEFASRLSYIWMSQRLIDTENGIASTDSGSKILVQLLNRSLLQGDVSRFTMHDLVHDLVEKIAKEEFHFVSGATGNSNLPKKLRHISFFDRNSDTEEISEMELKMLRNLQEHRALRTLLFFKFNEKVNDYARLLGGCFRRLIHLRALLLHNKYMTSLPESIGSLKLLRYLDLNLPSMKRLPDSVSNLHSLQVLLLSDCGLSKLNDSLSRLVNLEKLEVGDNWETFKNIGKLTKLQGLKTFHVKKQDGHRVMELQKLNKICGSLQIMNLENVKTKEEEAASQLDKKDGLQELELHWGDTSRYEEEEEVRSDVLEGLRPSEEEEVRSDVLEGLRPSSKVNKLYLNGYVGRCLPSWLNRGEPLPSLKAIKLHRCSKLEGIPYLPSCLEQLEIVDCPCLVAVSSLPPGLQHISSSNAGLSSSFPSSSCSQSPPPIPCLPSLRMLHVADCPNLDESLGELLKSSLPSLESLYIGNYSRPLVAFCYMTALSKLHLFKCSGKVWRDVRDLISLKDLKIKLRPSAAMKDPRPSLTPCTSVAYLTIHNSPSLLLSLSPTELLLSSPESLHIHGDHRGYHPDDSVLPGSLLGLDARELLVTEDCPSITSTPEEVLRALVSLEHLVISSCKNLKDLDLLSLRSLKSIHINDCPVLVFDHRRPRSSSDRLLRNVDVDVFSAEQLAGLVSFLEQCSNVKSVCLRNRGNLSIASGLERIGQLTTLENLLVQNCNGLPAVFPSLHLLRDLRIFKCSDVTSFSVPLNYLRYLAIHDCPHFTISDLPSTPFPSLEDLILYAISVQQLTHLLVRVAGSPLSSLEINGCDDLISFDGDLEQPFLSLASSLKELQIIRCGHLQRLPLDLREFKALRKLNIEFCQKVSSLPEERLPVCLDTLTIFGCPKLKALYGEREGNPHRQRISHIRDIRLI